MCSFGVSVLPPGAGEGVGSQGSSQAVDTKELFFCLGDKTLGS